MGNNIKVTYFYSLDLMRGIAALIVVIFHWNVFFDFSPEEDFLDKADMPLKSIFSIIYLYGYYAVDFFFCLSGFIFQWLYAERISSHKLAFRQYFILRLSRLYPLHFLTLALVICLQYFFLNRYGKFYFNGINDMYHIILNLFFIQTWGFQKGLSLNVPAWSISVEIFLYLVFFIVNRLKKPNLFYLLAIAMLGFTYFNYVLHNIFMARGMLSFFIGCAVFIIFNKYAQRFLSTSISSILQIATVFSWIFLIALHFALVNEQTELSFIINVKEWLPLELRKKILARVLYFGLIPGTILSLALLEVKHKMDLKRLSWLGTISYSSYLLHYPLQIICMILIFECEISPTVFHLPATQLIFATILLFISSFTYLYFERPMQKWIRMFSLKVK